MDNMLKLSLEGKVAIVTGGSVGIGRGIALEFAKAGADVVVASRRLAPLEEVAQEIKALGRRSLAVQTDVSKKSDVENLAQRVMGEFGGIDILVNNAGIDAKYYGPLQDWPEDEWDEVMAVNLKGCCLCSRAVSHKMIEQKRGNIINIASVLGLIRNQNKTGPYSLAKAGMITFSRGLAFELAPYNIRVNCILPGLIRTPMTEYRWDNPEGIKDSESKILLGRIGNPGDISSVALFLASDASSYIEGETIVVDGGRMWQPL